MIDGIEWDGRRVAFCVSLGRQSVSGIQGAGAPY
jgi:hypothetical protein